MRAFETLTAQEQEVLSFLVKGYSSEMMAAEMELGIETIRSHINNIYTKLRLNSKSETVIKALQFNFTK